METAKANAEAAQLTVDIAMLKKRYPGKTNAEAFSAWRVDLRRLPSHYERWTNYEWLTRVEQAAIKAGQTTAPTAAAKEIEP